ncbi:MAG TPA: DUF3341 domain-containing protein [Bryobacteraceae bacterium]|nr:DUF3341 domain-containing protein [Bryobacteraceae bacterium]
METRHTNTPELRDKSIYGIVAEFDRPEHLVSVGHKIHHIHGYTKLDALSPFPIHGIDDAIGVPRSILGFIVAGVGFVGFISAIALIYYAGVMSYPLVIGGKPLFAIEPSIPIMFELTVLLGAFAAVFGMFGLNKLPQFYHPVFNYPGFHGATDDKYLLVVEASDPKFDIVDTQRLLESLGARKTEVVEA